jgi:hypothetical protein
VLNEVMKDSLGTTGNKILPFYHGFEEYEATL